MKRFFGDLKKYFKYIRYSAFAELKSEVANSYLSWIWWILEPFCFMLIYVFISQVIFKTNEQYFQVFVFLGLTLWTFFNKCIITSVKLVSTNKDIVTKVYVPKWVLLLIKMFNNLFKYFISIVLAILFMIFYQVPFSWYMLWIIPITIVLFVVTFGFGCILMHFGVFVEDLYNVTNIGLRLVFYLTGIFYSIPSRMPAPYGTWLLRLNPIAALVNDARNSMLYQSLPNFKLLGIWLLLGLLLSIYGIRTIYKNENSYVKVMK